MKTPLTWSRKITHTQVLSGISDHVVVYSKLEIEPQRKKQIPCDVPTYKNVDWTGLKSLTNQLADKIRSAESKSNVGQLWCLFKEQLMTGIKEYISHHGTKSKDSCSWLTPAIRQKIRLRDKAFKNNKTGK